MTDLCDALRAAKAASRALGLLDDAARRGLLRAIAAALRAETPALLAANAADVAALPADNAFRDRLLLTPERVEGMAAGAEAVANLPDNLWQLLEERHLPSGLHLRRVRVPLGVVGCIYEARPNVTVDVACLCLRTGNAAALKGGKEAARTNAALGALLARRVADLRRGYVSGNRLREDPRRHGAQGHGVREERHAEHANEHEAHEKHRDRYELPAQPGEHVLPLYSPRTSRR